MDDITLLEFELGYITWGMTKDGRLDFVRLHRSPPLETCWSTSDEILRAHRIFRGELQDVLKGKPARWSFEPAWRGPAFYQKIWKTLIEEVPHGKTITYGDLAVLAGSPRAARGVGSAMANNPWALVVPCHRVLAAKGLGGYFGGELDWKVLLLSREGATIPE